MKLFLAHTMVKFLATFALKTGNHAKALGIYCHQVV